MKRLLFIFVCLFGVFLSAWTYKIKQPIARPDEYQEGVKANAGAWWKTQEQAIEEEWTLDHSIEANYIPVPGQENLFMVINNDGEIAGYKKRTKQMDGRWLWEDVDPNIPDDYEPVDGLENVYKVTDPDGTVSYVKYIRNKDDTFAFIEVDEHGEMINHETDATVIDGKHVLITGNTYSLLNDDGVVIGYDLRVENPDGTFEWQETDMPDMPSIDDIKSGITLGEGLDQTGGTALDNSALDQMAAQMQAANNAAANAQGDTYNIVINNNGGNSDYLYNSDAPTVINNEDGTHTERSVIRETKTIDGYTATYENVIEKTYDSAGNLLYSNETGPHQVSGEQAITRDDTPAIEAADPNAKLDTVNTEFARVSGSFQLDTAKASEVITKLNAYRSSKLMKPLQTSEEATKIAQLRAIDMAKYNTSDSKLPTYGSLGSMLTFYKIESATPGETLWKTDNCSAEDINTRFLVVDSARVTRLSEKANYVGIGIVVKESTLYIAEIVY